MNTILSLKNLSVRVENKEVISGLDLSINEGEVHLIMGPNGAGKSTLAKALIGYPAGEISATIARFCGEELFLLSPNERVKAGLFMTFQSPPMLQGVNAFKFLHLMTNSIRKLRGQDVLSKEEFEKVLFEKMDFVGLSRSFLARNVHEGFSGGEKKRFEMVAMALSEPKLAILDEVDSGLDLSAVKEIAQAAKHIMKGGSILVITHNPKFSDLFEVDVVHVFIDKKLKTTREKEVISRIEKEGYNVVI